MLHWTKIKKLIREIISPALLDQGFVQPGVSVWRTRSPFIDVVHFESRRAGTFQLEFGCGIRPFSPGQPMPWDCPFRVQPKFEYEGQPEIWTFLDSEAQQRQVLQQLAPWVADAAKAWFQHFATVQQALETLTAPRPAGTRLWLPRPDSPAFQSVLEQLESVL